MRTIIIIDRAPFIVFLPFIWGLFKISVFLARQSGAVWRALLLSFMWQRDDHYFAFIYGKAVRIAFKFEFNLKKGEIEEL